MFSYISFFNNTDFPFISIYEDGENLTEILLRHTESKFYITDAGSISVVVCDNHNKPFLNLYISLYPNERYTMNINNTFAEFI